jgi:pimeloyl-ACP methyl ester carboxylesterase
MAATVEPFTVAAPDAVLADLKARLDRSRPAADFANADWSYGTNGRYLAELVDYWRSDYDWRHNEALINRHAHFRTVIDGMPIHFIHEKGKGGRPIPLILNHGWPCTFWDFQKIIGPLTDPAAYGGDPADSFDVIIPSLPGYGFSTPLTTAGVTFSRTADMWVTLMRDILGYERFAVQGGDWGGFVGAELGHKYADHVIGLHLNSMAYLHNLSGQTLPPLEYAPDERAWMERTRHFYDHENAYMQVQSTKPQTLAFAMNDSPIGLCAWLLEKRRSWSDCGGDVERRFSKDDLITSAMLLWITESFGTSARYYYEGKHNPWRPAHDRMPVVEAPTAIAIFPEEVALRPRQWAERYFNLKRWSKFPAGGHFPAMEEPDFLVGDLRAFFRDLRP